MPQLPGHDVLVSELNVVRSRGLTRLRSLDLPGLTDVAAFLAGSKSGGDVALSIEQALKLAVADLGGGSYGEAAESLFGLAPGTRGLGPRERQERAGDCLGKSANTFRTKHQQVMVSAVADRLLHLLSQQPADDHASGEDAPGGDDHRVVIEEDNTPMADQGSRTIVTVVAVDLVNYSLESDQVQDRMVRHLMDIIRELSGSEWVVIPTGDGAYILRDAAPASDAVDLALALSRAIDDRLLRLPVRIGIHTGQAFTIAIPEGQPLYVGAALNLAQRIMDLGDDGHILLSRAVADQLGGDALHAPHIYPLPSNPVRVKHGVELDIFGYCNGSAGRATEPQWARRGSEVSYAQVGRRAQWEELFGCTGVVRAIDLSMPIFGIPSLIDHIERLIRSGDAELRILLMNPISPASVLRARSPAYKAEDELHSTIEYVLRILVGLRFSLAPYGEAATTRLDVRLYDAMPSFCGVISADQAWVSLYVDHLSGSRGPYFEIIRDSELGSLSIVQCLTESFDHLWRSSISVFAPDFLDEMKTRLALFSQDIEGITMPSYMNEISQ